MHFLRGSGRPGARTRFHQKSASLVLSVCLSACGGWVGGRGAAVRVGALLYHLLRHCSAIQGAEPPSACLVNCWMINPIPCERTRISAKHLWEGGMVGGAGAEKQRSKAGRVAGGSGSGVAPPLPPPRRLALRPPPPSPSSRRKRPGPPRQGRAPVWPRVRRRGVSPRPRRRSGAGLNRSPLTNSRRSMLPPGPFSVLRPWTSYQLKNCFSSNSAPWYFATTSLRSPLATEPLDSLSSFWKSSLMAALCEATMRPYLKTSWSG